MSDPSSGAAGQSVRGPTPPSLPEGWLCVAASLGLFSHRVVGWSKSTALTTLLAMDALVMAIGGEVRLQFCCIIPITAAVVSN